MEKRLDIRLDTEKEVVFYSNNSKCYGKISNCSANGMFIKPILSFPFDPVQEVQIPFRDKTVSVPVKIARIVKRDNYYEGIGVMITRPSKEYLKFIIKLSIDDQP